MIKVDIYDNYGQQLSVVCKNVTMTETNIGLIEPMTDMLTNLKDDIFWIGKTKSMRVCIQPGSTYSSKEVKQ